MVSIIEISSTIVYRWDEETSSFLIRGKVNVKYN